MWFRASLASSDHLLKISLGEIFRPWRGVLACTSQINRTQKTFQDPIPRFALKGVLFRQAGEISPVLEANRGSRRYSTIVKMQSSNKPDFVLYTDGACKMNPGKGGWGVVIYAAEDSEPFRKLCGGEMLTTNNRMELQAVIEGLDMISALIREKSTGAQAKLPNFQIVTDSTYVQKGVTEWMQNWERRGWKASGGKPVKNVDLWQMLRERLRSAETLAEATVKRVDLKLKQQWLTWKWVRGHAGDKGNEEADKLANQGVELLELDLEQDQKNGLEKSAQNRKRSGDELQYYRQSKRKA